MSSTMMVYHTWAYALCEGVGEDSGAWYMVNSISFNVKLEKNSFFMKNGKTVISVENRKFSRSRMTKRTAPLNSSRKI